ncbi:MAG: hypothetical protein FP825_09270 [Hyphomonas sp.]|uniref:hypothetical protein n=1 Tax=Hyphomonas sp. TaxID=87 RepID=UPI001857303E|nr:hypothetical protein [Hyphomonas sp.]MBA3068659.1 hypothetical protein [Hyphomonas sp.]MBU4061978.1 hypothetical protein [Alphaproteobacteria bacterium]MBU4166133.1 hypothetical protein [Alphaproteobacteria bacterium]
MLLRTLACIAIAQSLAGHAATAETLQARCKVAKTTDMSVSPQKVETTSDYVRSRPDFDWVFVYDLDLGRLCQVANEGICALISEDVKADDAGKLTGSTAAFSSGERGNLILSPQRGNWVFQTGLKQTMGGAGDCSLSPATPQQVALLFRDPARDIDLLCAGRLSVEAQILQSLGNDQTGGEMYRAEKLSQAQNIMAVAVSLLDRTGNRGYGRDESVLAAQMESEAYARRSEAERRNGFLECEARLQELNR